METREALVQALHYQRAGNFSRAEQLFREILQANPADADARNGLGIVLAQQDRLEEAAACFQEVLRRWPEDVKASNNLGLVRARQGRSEEAIACYRRALQLQPDSAAARANLAEALQDLPSRGGESLGAGAEQERLQQARGVNKQGIALARQGRLEEAATCFDRARTLWPEFADAHNNRGNIFLAQGQLDAARSCYREALRLQPDFADAHHNLGIVLGQLQDWEGAAASYRRALACNPDKAEAHHGLGVAREGQGQYEEAVACYRQALACNPDYLEAYQSLGVALQERGRPAEAVACFQRATACPGARAVHWNLLGGAHLSGENLGEAVAAFTQALRLQPDFPQAYNNLGNARRSQGNLEEAGAAFAEAVRLKPDYAEAFLNWGCALQDQGQSDKAIACCQKALRLKPDLAKAQQNWGDMLKGQGKWDEALAHFQEGVRLAPEDAELRFNRGLLWLLRGDWIRGWPDYECRWQTKASPRRRLPQPRWDGSPLEGRAILLYAEQGLGDTLQFIRYAPLVKQRGGTVIVECQPPLLDLLAQCPGIDRLLPRGAPLPPFDVEAPLLSLPALFQTTPQTVPALVPYLAAADCLVERWRRELAAFGPGFRIGLIWQGNPAFRADRLRSIPLAQFAPLARLGGVRLFSLQVGPSAEQLAETGQRLGVVDLGSCFDRNSLADVAAVLKNLDLLISSCTAIPHLAGALGVPVWLALPFVPDWRWLLEREDSPWYPHHRLFRQRRLGTWEEVMERITQEVRQRVAGREKGPRESNGV